jgi:transcriptional regulator with XRE-family HTH domain
MTIVEITGGMLRAARSLTGLSQQELAERASISRPCLTAWEGSSGSVPNAKARALHRVVAALEAEGIRFSDSGVPPVCQIRGDAARVEACGKIS